MTARGTDAAAELARHQLADRIERLAENVARRALSIMYANPFWDDRFGARGRRFAEEDGRHHVAYLCEALRQGDAHVMRRYARWLQSVLTTRGMCTAHLDENFERIGGVLLSESLPDGNVAIAMLDAARRALCSDRGPAREVQDASDALGVAVRAALEAAQPGWRDRWGADSGTRLTASVEWQVAYLADALALSREDQFAGYIAWLDDFAARRGVAPGLTAAMLDALGRALDRLPPATARSAREALGRARALAAVAQRPAIR